MFYAVGVAEGCDGDVVERLPITLAVCPTAVTLGGELIAAGNAKLTDIAPLTAPTPVAFQSVVVRVVRRPDIRSQR